MISFMRSQRLNKKWLLMVFVLILTACQQNPTPTPEPDVETPVVEDAATPTGEIVPTETAVVEDSDSEETTSEEDAETVTELGPQEELPSINTFEDTPLQSGSDGAASIGFLTWSDGSPISIESVSVEPGDPLARPNQSEANTVLQINTDVGSGGWAGFSNAFANETVDQWVTQDWSAYEGFSLWLYGNNSGGTIFVDILDNRAPGSTADDAERWNYDMADDFSGWQYIEIPFDAFRRKDIGNGAPNDGLSFENMHGYAVGVYGSVDMPADPIYVDDVALYGVAPERPVEIQLLETAYIVREGGRAVIRLKLNKPTEAPVTVQVGTIQGTAVSGEDFILSSESVAFEPGNATASFEIDSVDDELAEGTERTLIVLSQPEGALLNVQSRAILTIRDNEPAVENVWESFNTPPPFVLPDGVTMDIQTAAVEAELALPDQAVQKSILQVAHDEPATLQRMFGTAQDWSAHDGLSLWYYGTGSGEPVTVQLANNRATTTAVTDPAAWELVWSDEFDGPEGMRPNPGIWQPEIGDGLMNSVPGWGNGELEYYTDDPENASMDGEGNLVITAVAQDSETTNLSCWYGPCEYTSARLITLGNAEFEFGRIEARLKLPEGQGLWPAFWMLGTDIGEVSWPQSGEIDIMENIGREPATFHGTIHGPGYSGGAGIGASYDLSEGTVADDFHIVAIEWQPDSIKWTVDGEEYHSATPDDIPAGTEWVYNHPFFIIMNVAVGGNWPGLPDETTTFPQSLMVDYVRVYGAPETAEQFEFTFEDDFTGWQQISLPFSEFTRSSEQPEGALDDGLTLNEIWGYQLVLPQTTEGVTHMASLQFE